MDTPKKFEWARRPAGVAPARRARSVRRTTTIDTRWPDGFGAPMAMHGHGRDIYTAAAGADPHVLAEEQFHILASLQREILEIRTDPDLPGVQQLVGVRAGGASRRALAAILGERIGSPLFQLLDDFAGASLVAGWIWSRWTPDWRKRMDEGGNASTPPPRTMTGICTGFAPGSSALSPVGSADHASQSSTSVGPLVDPADPAGWHALTAQSGPEMRRSRRIDIWREGHALQIDASFQDSGAAPDGGRAAIHEYLVRATVDPLTMTLTSIAADPRILPYRECPGAALHVGRMIGMHVDAFRELVVAELPGTLGCTHLNDVLRAFADIPRLSRHLDAVSAGQDDAA